MLEQSPVFKQPTLETPEIVFQNQVALVKKLKIDIATEKMLGKVDENDKLSKDMSLDINKRITDLKLEIAREVKDMNVFCIQLETVGLGEEAEMIKAEFL